MSINSVFSHPVRKVKADKLANLSAGPFRKGGGGTDNQGKDFNIPQEPHG